MAFATHSVAKPNKYKIDKKLNPANYKPLRAVGSYQWIISLVHKLWNKIQDIRHNLTPDPMNVANISYKQFFLISLMAADVTVCYFRLMGIF